MKAIIIIPSSGRYLTQFVWSEIKITAKIQAHMQNLSWDVHILLSHFTFDCHPEFQESGGFKTLQFRTYYWLRWQPKESIDKRKGMFIFAWQQAHIQLSAMHNSCAACTCTNSTGSHSEWGTPDRSCFH